MPVQTQTTQDGELFISYDRLSNGLDTKSNPIELSPTHVADCQNVMVPGGFYKTVFGHALAEAGFILPDAKNPQMLALYSPSSGATQTYIAIGQDGIAYAWDGSAWDVIRSGLTASATGWWDWTQLGDYLICTNPTDGVWKYDGSNFIPLGAKLIADMETGEATWAGGTVDAVNYKEGIKGRKLTGTAGGTDSMTLTPATAWDLETGLLDADDYGTSDYIDFWVYIDTVANLTLANTYIRLGNAGDTVHFQLAATGWGTLADGWNKVHALKSAFTDTGGASWATLAKLTFYVDAAVGVSVNCTFDDVYTVYANVLPGGQYVRSWKNMVMIGRSTADPSVVFYSLVGSPDYFDPAAQLPIELNDGSNITGMFPYYDFFLVFKDNSVHVLQVRLGSLEYPGYNFGLRRVTTEHGCSSHRGLVEAGGRLFIPWRDTFYEYAGNQTIKISYRIDPTLQDYAAGYMSNMVGAPMRSENLVMWFWTADGDTTNSNCIIYDYAEKAFLPVEGQSMGTAITVYEAGVEKVLTVDYTGRILLQNSGTTFDTVAFTSYVYLPWVSGGQPHYVTSWRELQLSYENQTSGDLVVQYRTAAHPREFSAAAWSTAGTIDMSVTGERGRVFIGERSRWLQVRFYTTAAMTVYWPITLKGRSLGYIV